MTLHINSLHRNQRVKHMKIIIALNFTPVARHGYRIGLPRNGEWTEILNSDSEHYWGSGVGNMGAVAGDETPHHGRTASMEISLPPLGAVFFKNLDPWVEVAHQSEPESADPTEPWDMEKVKRLSTDHAAKSKE